MPSKLDNWAASANPKITNSPLHAKNHITAGEKNESTEPGTQC